MKIYLDNDIVSALARPDDYQTSPDEQAAVNALESWARREGHRLVTSEVSRREFERTPMKQTRQMIEVKYSTLPKVEFLEDHSLLGYTTVTDPYGGFVQNPLVEDHPIARQFWEIGLRRADAHHLLVAVTAACDVFLTCDRGILSRAARIREAHTIHIVRPSELVSGTLEHQDDGPS